MDMESLLNCPGRLMFVFARAERFDTAAMALVPAQIVWRADQLARQMRNLLSARFYRAGTVITAVADSTNSWLPTKCETFFH